MAYRPVPLRYCDAIPGTDVAYGAYYQLLSETRISEGPSVIFGNPEQRMLLASYATPSTDVAYAATCLRACYAVSGTVICAVWYCDTRYPVLSYALSGTERACGTARIWWASG
eukprot:3940399-Rhodomonas_salina.2